MSTLAAFALALLALALPAFAQPQPDDERRPDPPTLTVTGQAEVSARPDQATVRLGAVAQAEQAGAAQQQVNRIMEAAIEKIKALGIADAAISTAGLSLQPVYNQPPPRPANDQPFEPQIVAYRASNTVQVRIDDLSKVGPIIDAGVGAGANQLEGLTFELKDDTEAKSRALRQAVASARAKATAIAEAMDIRLGPVHNVTEVSNTFMPRMEYGVAMARMAADVSTPVQPGQVQINATITVQYRIGGMAGGAGGAGEL